MNKVTQSEIDRAAEIMANISKGIKVNLIARDLKLLPEHFSIMSPTTAKKQGLILKRNAEPIGTIEWKIPGAGYGHGQLYLGCSFKPKN